MARMSAKEAELRLLMRDDFEAYGAACLKIRTKSGELKPLRLNRSQRALHERLERARIIVQEDKVSPVLGMDEHYIVESSAGDGSYLVNDTCSCWDAKDERRYELTRNVCKHKLAVILYMEAKEGDSNGNDDADANDEGNTDDK